MAVIKLVKALAAITVSGAAAGGAWVATRSAPPTATADTAATHPSVMVETKEAPAAEQSSVKVGTGKNRIEVRRSKGDGEAREVKVRANGKEVEVQRDENGDEKSVKTGNVSVEKKNGAVKVKVGNLVVDTQE